MTGGGQKNWSVLQTDYHCKVVLISGTTPSLVVIQVASLRKRKSSLIGIASFLSYPF